MSAQPVYPPEKVVTYDPRWPVVYERYAIQFREALGSQWRVEHVGSTSVPGLPAKPVIDLALGLPSGEEVDTWRSTFLDLGWTVPRDLGDHEATFLLADDVRIAIGHVFTAEQWPTAHLRLFPDWLRRHDADRDAYARLKLDLVAGDVWGEDYTSAKRDFVEDVVLRARHERGLGREIDLR